MPRVTKVIDATVDEVEEAKQSAVALAKQTAMIVMDDSTSINALDLFYSDDLEYIEAGIKKLNDFSSKSWLLSAILLYTIIYDNGLFAQSGLSWQEYSKEARTRLGLDAVDITNQLSAARFFIKHQKELERKGFNPIGCKEKLARAELAVKLCGDVHLVIQHLVSDSWRDFKKWYSLYKPHKALPPNEKYRPEIEVKNSRFYIGRTEAVKVSDKIPEADRQQLEKCIEQIFEIMKNGDFPAIVSTYNEKEARVMARLRDKYRQGK